MGACQSALLHFRILGYTPENASVLKREAEVSPEFERIRERADQLAEHLSDEDWWRAPEGEWNAAQIFEHLLLTYTNTTKALLRAFDRGTPSGSRSTLRQRLRTKYVLGFHRLPAMQAPERAIPPEKGSVEKGSDEVLYRFKNGLVALDATLTDAERRFGSTVRMLNHPLLGPLNAHEWRRFHLIHALHHFKQAAERSQRA